MTESIKWLQNQTKRCRPLIHCITNPISLHDCANVILAAGGRPIMAEHPREVAQITASADALMLNLGNITDARMESMKIALKTAKERSIPVLLDLVGVACSDLRMAYVKELFTIGYPAILKGNMSEILAMAGRPSHSIGIDAGKEDALTEANREQVLQTLHEFSIKTGTVILASGKEDLIVGGHRAYLIANGDPMLSEITGTGCMLGALCTAFLASDREEGIHAAVLAVASMGIVGELAAKECPGTGTFQVRLLDCLYQLDEELMTDKARIYDLSDSTLSIR